MSKTLLPVSALALFASTVALAAADPGAVRVAGHHEKLFRAMRGVVTLEVTRCEAEAGSALLVPCLKLHACQNQAELEKVFGNPFELDGYQVRIQTLETCVLPPRGGFIVHN